MFKRTKVKIIVVIMTAMLFALTGTLAVIYAASYAEVYQKNLDMLERYVDMYFLEGRPNGTPSSRPSLPGRGKPEDATFLLSTFYSVSFSADVEVDSINNEEFLSLAKRESQNLPRLSLRADPDFAAGFNQTSIFLLYNDGRKIQEDYP